MDLLTLLFIDIETVPAHGSLIKAPKTLQDSWVKKSNKEDKDPESSYLEEAALYPEFGKICCISMGMFVMKEDKQYQVRKFRMNSLYGSDEKKILKEFSAIMDDKVMSRYSLVAHNGMNFDYPYIAKRCVVNGIHVPSKLMTWGKKPWELDNLKDTMKLWSFGAWGQSSSLESICGVLNVPSPKSDGDGSKVREYYQNNQWGVLVKYCEGDILATARILQRMLYIEPVGDELTQSVTKFGEPDKE